MASLSLNPRQKLQNTLFGTSAPRGRWNTRCLCAIVRHKTPSVQNGREREIDCVCLTLTLENQSSPLSFLSLKCLKPLFFALERVPLYMPLVKLTRQALQEGDPSIHVYGGEQKLYSCPKISAKADEQQSAGKKCHLGQTKCRPAQKSADRQQIVPTGKLYCRWQQKPAGGI